MKEYPNIELRWKEVGLSFQVQFVKKDFILTEMSDGGLNGGLNEQLLSLINKNNTITVNEIAETLKLSLRKCERTIAELKEQGRLERKGSKKSGYWEIK